MGRRCITIKKIDNKGFTLIETLLCFVILGIIMVIASQIIHSSTETYYLNRSVSYGMQAAQIVSTEIRGEIEDALPLYLYNVNSKDYRNDYYLNICSDENNKYIEFINSEGKQIKYSFEKVDNQPVLKKYYLEAYDNHVFKKKFVDEDNKPDKYPTDSGKVKVFDPKYIGMGYEIKDINITKFNPKPVDNSGWNNNDGSPKLEIGSYPILELTIKVGNNQYDEYECKEYIALYNFYGLTDTVDEAFDSIINIG